MFYENDDINFKELEESFDKLWVKDSVETLDDETYNVYYGTGDSSLVKLKINEDIVVDL